MEKWTVQTVDAVNPLAVNRPESVRLSHSTNLNGALKTAGIIELEEASSAIAALQKGHQVG